MVFINNFQIYGEILRKNKSNKNNNLCTNTQLLIKKNINLKSLFVYTNKLFKFIFFFINKQINFYFYWIFYKIIIYHVENCLNIKYMHILSLNNIYLYLYKFNVQTYIWLNFYLLNHTKFNKYIYIYNKFNSINLIFNKLIIDNLWYNLIQLILIEYIDLLFFKFYNELNYLKNNHKIKKKFWIQCWVILKRSQCFEWINVKVNLYSMIKKSYYEIII